MNARIHRRKGAALLMAVALVGVASVAALLLMQAVDSATFSADRAYARACSENLQSSAQAWARAHGGGAAAADGEPGRTVNLDVGAMGVPGGSVAVRADKQPGSAVLETSVHFGRHVIRTTTRAR